MARRGRKKAAPEPTPEQVAAAHRIPPSRQNRVFFVSLLIAVLFLSALLFRPFLASVLTGLLLAYFAYPVYTWVRRVVRLRALSGVVSLLFVLAIFVFPLVAFGIALIDDAQDFATQLVAAEPPAFVLDGLEHYARFRVDDPDNATLVAAEKQQFISGMQRQAATFLIDRIPDIIALVSEFVVGLFIVSFVMFYVFVDGKDLVGALRRALPLPPHQTNFLLAETKRAVDAIFIGQLASAVLQGFVGGLGFFLFGVPNAIFWGAVMAVLSLLPVVGAFLVWGPAALLLISGGDLFDGVMLLVWGVVLVSNVDNVAKPILIGDRADIHPVLVLIGVLGGLSLFGFIGFIIGPLVLGLAVAFLKVWNEEYHDRTGWTLGPTGAPVAAGTAPTVAAAVPGAHSAHRPKGRAEGTTDRREPLNPVTDQDDVR